MSSKKESQIVLYAIPGFLGKSGDWHDVLPLEKNLIPVEINNFSMNSLGEWAANFNEFIDQKNTPSSNDQVLMGYSLGGRLALHALIQNSQLWKAAIIISAHLGLETTSEKEKRKAEDECWAADFESGSWEKLMLKWENRAVFASETFKFIRKEKDYLRSDLAKMLRAFSLGSQEYLLSKLCDLQIPVLWCTGEHDTLYSQQTEKLVLKHPFSKILILAKSGHRLPWEKPDQFRHELNAFLKKIEAME